MRVTLRAAAQADAAFIVAIEEICMRAYAEALWGHWRPGETAEMLALDSHEIIERDGAAIGCVAAYWRADHLFVDKLYIDPGFQNVGIGAYVLRQKTEEAARQGLPTRLSVLTTNPARRFYEREGFRLEAETAERFFMIRDPLP